MGSQGIYYLFVYGSLRSGFQSPAYEYISRFFTPAGNAQVKGRLYDMGSYPAGVPCEEEYYITGELYRIRDEQEFSWVFGQLDDYEGVSAEMDEVQLYRRDITIVHAEGMAEPVPAWIYWYSGDVSGKSPVESGDILRYLQLKK